MQPYIICYRGVAHPWLCDRLGHLNTRNYFAALDDAMIHFFSILGYEQRDDFGWVDVNHNITYFEEISLGSLFHIESALTRLGRKAVSYRQKVILSDSLKECAVCESTSVLFDMSNRVAVELPAILRENGGPYLIKEEGSD